MDENRNLQQRMDEAEFKEWEAIADDVKRQQDEDAIYERVEAYVKTLSKEELQTMVVGFLVDQEMSRLGYDHDDDRQ